MDRLNWNRGDVLDLLGRLVDKSLVVAEPGEDGTLRYRLQEVLRQFSWERLAEGPQMAVIQARHAKYFLALVQDAEQRALTGDRRAWLDRLELELDNFRAARRWFVAGGDAESAQSLCACLYRLLVYRSHANEGRASLVEALALPGSSLATRAKAVHFLGALGFIQADYDAAWRYAQESLVLRREIGDQTGVAWALGSLAAAAIMRGDLDVANRLLEEARDVGRTLDDRYIHALNLSLSALATYHQGDVRASRAHAIESMDLADSLGFNSVSSMAQSTLGNLNYLEGDLDAAISAFRAALDKAEALGEPYLIIRSATSLGLAFSAANDPEGARALLARGLRLAERLGNAHRVAHAVEDVAAFAAEQGQPVPALMMAGAAAALRATIGAPLSPTEHQLLEARLGSIRTAVGPRAFDEGRTWSVEDAAALACEFLNAISGSPVPRYTRLVRRLPPEPPSSEITPESLYLRRREFIKNGALTAGHRGGLRDGPGVAGWPAPAAGRAGAAAAAPVARPHRRQRTQPDVDTDEALTAFQASHHLQQLLRVRARQGRPGRATRTRCRPGPWTISVEGEVAKPQTIDIDDAAAVVPARGARVPHALRRGLVDGHPVAGLPAGRPDQAAGADRQREIRRVHDAAGSRSRCPASAIRC